MLLRVGGEVKRNYTVELAEKEPYTWFFIDVSEFNRKTMTIELLGTNHKKGLDKIHLSNVPEPLENAYKETWRPQFHFSPERGWTNDPNGLVYYKGEYHMFFQHNPLGTKWGNMTWGHAVSRDLVHWTEIGDAIQPDTLGTIYSGSAVVDMANTSGFQTGREKPIVVFYTSAGSHAYKKVPFTQSLAYSNDCGRTWTKNPNNPVLGNIIGSNRDPKVIWHEPSKRWVMALYLTKNKYALFTSPNLKQWTHASDVPMPGVNECPDIFSLPVDGNPANTKWVFWGGNGNYEIGEFDGTAFKGETEPLQTEWGGNCYAAQTWSNIPEQDGRRILIGWMRTRKDPKVSTPVYDGMPFNQQMSFPRSLTLRTTPDGIRLFMEPVREISLIHSKEYIFNDTVLNPGDNPLADVSGELFDINTDINIGDAKSITLNLRGEQIVYDAEKETLSCRGRSVPLTAESGRINMRVLLDRTSIEIFAGHGRYVMSFALRIDPDNKNLVVSAQGGTAKIADMQVYELEPALPVTDW